MTNHPRPLIALACIAGNEQHQIERFIRSFAPICDFMQFVIARGNQPRDETENIIVQACSKIRKPFDIRVYKNKTDLPFVDDFGAARQMAWEHAAATYSKYLIWADSDDLLPETSIKAFRDAVQNGEQDIYLCPYHVRGSAQIVYRERMIRNDKCSSWQYPIHEQLKFNRDVTYKALHDAVIVHAPFERRAPSSERNLAILHEAVKDTARNFFYLQQECFGMNDFEGCKKYGNIALLAPSLEVMEKYEILLNLAQSYSNADSKKLASQAFSLMPDRRESLALLVNYSICDKDYEKANQLARLMMGIPKPAKTYWTMNHDWYGWKGIYLYTQTLRLVGRGREARNLELDQLHKSGGIKISLLHATRGRAAAALAARDIWLSRASKPMQIEHIYSMDGDDLQSKDILGGFHGFVSLNNGCVSAWNLAAKMSLGDVLIQLSDDWMPPMGWDEAILSRLDSDKEQVLAISDGHRKDSLLCMAILTRKYYEKHGLFHEGFESVYSDDYFTWLAYKNDAVVEARDLVFMHNNPYFQTGNFEADETYKRSNAPEKYERGKNLFDQLVKEP